MVKHGIYKLKSKLHSCATGPFSDKRDPVDSVDLIRGFEGTISCYLPHYEGSFEPQTLAEAADVINLSMGTDMLCCSNRLYAVLQQTDMQPHHHRMINVNNSKYRLGEYHLIYVGMSDRIPVFDYEHSQLDGSPANDGKPLVFGLDYQKQLFIVTDKLPDYDLFLSEALRWMATAKLLKLCKEHRIKGLHFDWLGNYTEP